MNQLKCKDYFIIKARYYASEYHLAKFLKGDSKSHKKHADAARNHNDFLWKFIIKLLGDCNYYEKYPLDARECAMEEVHETYGIIIRCGEGYYKYFIPKKYTELVEWIKENLKENKVPYKVLKKTYVGFMDITPTTYHREMSDEYKIKNHELLSKIKYKNI